MSNMMSAGAAWLALELASNAAVEITYTRGTSSVQLNATAGSYLLKLSEPNGGFRIVHTDRDYVFPAQNLILDGVVTVPQSGDQITEVTADGVTRTYVVMTYGGGEPLYRYSDPFRTLMRVHTKATSGGA
jgi:hypothetical protein